MTATQQITEFLSSLNEGETTNVRDICELFDKDHDKDEGFRGTIYVCLSKACDKGILVKSKSKGRMGNIWKRIVLSTEEILEYEISPLVYARAVFEYVKEQDRTIKELKGRLKSGEHKGPDFQEMLRKNTLLQEKLDKARIENGELRKRMADVTKAVSLK